ncbi:Nuclear receptor corepressor 2, partial [Lemmus lemmus]
ATAHLQDRSLAGKLEPVSPPSPPHADPELDLAPSRLSKEELIQNMDRVDREITMVEQQISKLKKKQVSSEGGRGTPVEAGTRATSPGALSHVVCQFLGNVSRSPWTGHIRLTHLQQRVQILLGTKASWKRPLELPRVEKEP